MVRTSRDRETRAIFEGRDLDPVDAKRARRRLPTVLWKRARAKLDQLDAAADLRALRTPSNRLEKLAGDRAGEFSIRINRQYRVTFRYEDGDAFDVEIVDYHD